MNLNDLLVREDIDPEQVIVKGSDGTHVRTKPQSPPLPGIIVQ